MNNLKKIDFRSDTKASPTENMRNAMKNAVVGDDGYQEDPTVNQLEMLSAKKMGKEAALFVASGTMGNLIAVLTHCQRGEELILEPDIHMYYAEIASISALTGVIPRLLLNNKRIHDPQAIFHMLNDKKNYYRKRTLICLENTILKEGGIIIQPKTIDEISQIAHQRNIKVHLDGARLFNAAIALNIEANAFTKNVDSVVFCLYKGLCAPVGSILAGSKKFIQKARANRKLLGGLMRKGGVLAAAGIIAIEQMVERLIEDHENARILSEGLSCLDKIRIDLKSVQTNIVHLNIEELDTDSYKFLAKLAKYNILGMPCSPNQIRLYTHYEINSKDIDATITAIREIIKGS